MNKLFEKAKNAAIKVLEKDIVRLEKTPHHWLVENTKEELAKVKALNNFPVKSEQLKDVDVAVKAKILKAHLEHELPNIKFSVKSSRFAGGTALDVFIVTPKEEFTKADTDKAQKIVEIYTHDKGSDPMTDYCAVDNFAHINNVPYWEVEVA